MCVWNQNGNIPNSPKKYSRLNIIFHKYLFAILCDFFCVLFFIFLISSRLNAHTHTQNERELFTFPIYICIFMAISFYFATTWAPNVHHRLRFAVQRKRNTYIFARGKLNNARCTHGQQPAASNVNIIVLHKTVYIIPLFCAFHELLLKLALWMHWKASPERQNPWINWHSPLISLYAPLYAVWCILYTIFIFYLVVSISNIVTPSSERGRVDSSRHSARAHIIICIVKKCARGGGVGAAGACMRFPTRTKAFSEFQIKCIPVYECERRAKAGGISFRD